MRRANIFFLFLFFQIITGTNAWAFSIAPSKVAQQKSTLIDRNFVEDPLILRFLDAGLLENQDATKACSQYSELAGNSDFALADLAFLKTHNLCENGSSSSTPQRVKEILEKKPYLKLLSRVKVLDEDSVDLPVKGLPSPLDGAQRMINKRNFAKARSVLEKVISDEKRDLGLRYQAFKIFRNSYKAQQNRNAFLREARKLGEWTLKTKQPIDVVHEAHMAWARAEWTEGFSDKALNILNKVEVPLASEAPQVREKFLGEVHWLRGSIFVEKRDYSHALENFVKAEQSLTNKADVKDPLLPKALFAQAWMQRKLKNYTEAAQAFKRLSEQTRDAENFRARFWMAKSLRDASKNSEAEEIWKKVASEDSVGFYGLVSYYELGLPLPPLKSAASPETVDIPLTQKQWDEFQALKVVTPESLFFMALNGLSFDLRSSLIRKNADWFFPQSYSEIVQKWAEKYNLESEFVLSIIRQESAFNPKAHSPMHAMGLMQVLPSVARKYHVGPKVNYRNPQDLYVPEVNIPIGTNLLSKLHNKYKGQFILMVSAYNANENAINTWVDTRLSADPLEFIEDIPYEETRTYVRLVMRNYVFYKRLRNPNESLPFPKGCLEDLQSLKVSTAERPVSQ